MINGLLKYGIVFIILFLLFVLIWKLSELMPKFLLKIKMNPTLMDPNRAKENYVKTSMKIAERVADKTCSGSKKERRKNGIKMILIGVGLIVVSIIIHLLKK